jgi:hypothetical protein
MRRLALRLGFLFFAFAIFNFLAFHSISLAIHGDAEKGKVVNGRYYVNYKGEFTEVSKGTFQYSYYHGLLNKITFGLAIVGFLIMLPSNQLLKTAADQCKNDLVTWGIGALLGLFIGALFAICVPLLLETQRWRSIWWDTPLFALFGAAVAGGAHLVWIADREQSSPTKT